MDEEKKANDMRSLLRKGGLDNPSPAFSSVIMRELDEEPQRDLQLQTLLRAHVLETPSESFTESVMKRIKNADSASSIQPVISRTTWAIVVITLVVFSVWMLYSNPSSQDPGLTTTFVEVGRKISVYVSGVPSLYLIICFAASGLLVGDYLIRMAGAANKTRG